MKLAIAVENVTPEQIQMELCALTGTPLHDEANRRRQELWHKLDELTREGVALESVPPRPQPVPPPPELQELVAWHGGYDKITADAWRAFDCAMNEWRQTLRTRMPAPDCYNKHLNERRSQQYASTRRWGRDNNKVGMLGEVAEFFDAEQDPALGPVVNPFFGRCACGRPGLYHVRDSWFCEDCKLNTGIWRRDDLRAQGSAG
jgi:hypothetical protein